MSILKTMKHLLTSLVVTFFIYCGYIPFMMLQPPTFDTVIELAPPPIPMTLDEASLEALHTEALGIDDRTEEALDTVDIAGNTDEVIAPPKPQPEFANTSLKRKDGIAPRTEPIPKKITTRKKNKKSRKCRPENPNIKKLNSTTYNLPKTLIRHYGSHWEEANRLAYLAWSVNRSGDIQGIKIRHISCKSPLPFTGLRKGDIITAVNGKPVTSQAKLMRLYTRVFHWKNIELTLIRKGRPMKINYKVVA